MSQVPALLPIATPVGTETVLMFSGLCQAPDCRTQVVRFHIPTTTYLVVALCSKCGAETCFKGTPYGIVATLERVGTSRAGRRS